MKNGMAARLERPMSRAVAYLLFDFVFIAIACLNQERWVIWVCAFFSAITSVKAIALFTLAILSRDEFEEEFSHRINLPRN